MDGPTATEKLAGETGGQSAKGKRPSRAAVSSSGIPASERDRTVEHSPRSAEGSSGTGPRRSKAPARDRPPVTDATVKRAADRPRSRPLEGRPAAPASGAKGQPAARSDGADPPPRPDTGPPAKRPRPEVRQSAERQGPGGASETSVDSDLSEELKSERERAKRSAPSRDAGESSEAPSGKPVTGSQREESPKAEKPVSPPRRSRRPRRRRK